MRLDDAVRRSGAPMAERRPVELSLHGRVRSDPYAWLKAENWREVMRDQAALPADIRAHLEAENAWTHAALEQPLTALQEALFAEMRGRIRDDDSSPPAIDGPWAYYRRFRAGGEYPAFCRTPAAGCFEPGAPETVLLDGDALAEGRDYVDFRRVAHSPDHRLLAWTLDDRGSELYTLRVRDVASGLDLDQAIPETFGEFAWSADSASIFWVARDESNRPVAVHRRDLATARDELVYAESDPGFFVGVHASASRRFIFITSGNHETSEWRYLRADAPAAAPTLILPRETGHEYSVVDFDDGFVIRSNADGATDFRLVWTPVGTPDRSGWREIAPHRKGVLLLDALAFRRHLVRLEREGGLPRIVVRDLAGDEHAIAFDEAAYSLGLAPGYAYDTATLRFEYASPSTPARVWDYDMAARTRVLRKEQVVPSGHDPADYVVERLDAPADDGAPVPVTLLRRRTTPVDGSAPVLLYGYGAYGISLPADFRTGRLSLVDRGFVYAIADVRGSIARGYDWYLDGKLANKTNSFTDFLAAARTLVQRGYTRRGGIVALGGSAGGTLVAAAANLDPGMFAGVIAAVPFVDVLNTMCDASLPLTPPEWPEWGNPVADPEAHDRLAGWAPYEQVADRPYPPILATGGLTDPRVTYWEPAKWIARLRHDAPSGGPYFLRINMDAGHGGASGRYASLRETALEFAFALAAVGLADGAADGRRLRRLRRAQAAARSR